MPLLTSIFLYQGADIDNVVHLALGTSLACMIISSTASIRAHASKQNVSWAIFASMTPGIIVGAFITTHMATHINSLYLSIFFAFFMALIAGMMFFNWQPKTSATPTKLRDLIFVGTGIGTISALAAVGGGFLTISYLSYKNFPMRKAVGTSSAIGFPIAIAGTIGYMVSGWSKTTDDPHTFGFICVPAFLAISISSFIAAPYGAACAQKLSDMHLKKIFAAVSLALSLKMFLSFV
ncbi:Protein of unknown function DUF81 [Micavibrio aeruginosavorus EPB]|uniref:Probable membrane transporter protein n=1 Tax=Micavibrio aeruginosavorus EPB TaxID=349215 RepID=M4VFT2_9BACT|nr:Protein of unknown function DUF81 [Micavibrio aeruginosavorus EPB]